MLLTVELVVNSSLLAGVQGNLQIENESADTE